MNANRFLMMSGVAAVVLTLSVAGLLSWQQTRVLQAHDAHVREQLLATQRLVEAQHRSDLHGRAEQVAGDPAFAGYVEQAMGGALPGMPVDTTSIVDLLRERQNQLGLTAVAVLDRNGRIVATTTRLPHTATLQSEPIFQRARADLAVATGVWAQGDTLLHVAVLPLAAVGVSEGFLLAGMPVDLQFAQAIASASGADVLLRAADTAPAVASTLRSAVSTEQALAGASNGAGRVSVRVDGVDRPLISVPLMESKQVRLVMIAPDGPRSALASAVRLPWLAGGTLLLLALAGAGAWLWRHVLRPVEAIAGRLDRASGGDYHLHFPEDSAGTMVPLASAFNRLMARLRV